MDTAPKFSRVGVGTPRDGAGDRSETGRYLAEWRKRARETFRQVLVEGLKTGMSRADVRAEIRSLANELREADDV